MSRKPEYSKKILKLLAERPAVAVESISSQIAPKEAKYAVQRSLKALQEAGFISEHSSGQKTYARLTKDGRKRAHSAKLDSDTALVNPNWDGKWRIVLIDFPESRKAERDGIRYLLKKAGFVMLKNSVWVTLHQFEHFFMSIKKDLNLSTEVMIFVTDTVDEETLKAFNTLRS